jgi:hypothetical protein
MRKKSLREPRPVDFSRLLGERKARREIWDLFWVFEFNRFDEDLIAAAKLDFLGAAVGTAERVVVTDLDFLLAAIAADLHADFLKIERHALERGAARQELKVHPDTLRRKMQHLADLNLHGLGPLVGIFF